MLSTLRIKNLALVADLTLELQPGYNVITGETGAGKSIMIGALNLILGERADRSLIRSGCESCSVEAVFDLRGVEAPLVSLLEENGLEPCEDQQLVLKRALTLAGVNRQFINGSPSTLNVLAAVGEWLVDIHGPHEHQSLLHPARQLAILDAFGKFGREVESFGALVRGREQWARRKAELVMDEKAYAQQLDLLRFQTAEINAAQLRPGEEEEVEAGYKRASNAARLLELSQTVLELVSEGEGSLTDRGGAVGRALQDLRRLDDACAPLVTQHEQWAATLQELAEGVSRYRDRLELDPAGLRQLEERLNMLQTLRRKYGGTIAEVLAFGDQAQRRLQALESRESELERINAESARLEEEIWRAGQSLSAKRRKLAPQLGKAVSAQLADLGFNRSWFEVSARAPTREEFARDASLATARGMDTIEFQFAPNPGEPARPLRSIASSGELARVMLALKTVLAEVDEVPVLVFDEVDANVGGETARAVGEKMRKVARRRQVLCITHLPQVAAPAGAHFLASKQLEAGRTISRIHLLSRSERVEELTRMLGGQGSAARKHAEALLKAGNGD